MNTYPRETREFQAVNVSVYGALAATSVQLAVTNRDRRPTVWFAPTVLAQGDEERIGFMVKGYAPGTWHVWAKVTSNPEIPVIDCGSFRVT